MRGRDNSLGSSVKAEIHKDAPAAWFTAVGIWYGARENGNKGDKFEKVNYSQLVEFFQCHEKELELYFQDNGSS